MNAGHAPQPAPRIASLAPAWEAVASGAERPFDVTFGGPFGEPEQGGPIEAIDRLPAWLAGSIVVGLSSVFWVGLLTILGWII